MMTFNARSLLTVCLAAATGVISATASAQEYPAKPITIVVPFSAGGGVDTIARLLAEQLRKNLKQSVVVDNKAGGGGMIGALAVVKAPADGYTLLLGSAGETAINPFVYKNKMQYSPSKDLTPITIVAKVPNVLVAGSKFVPSTVQALIEHAKRNPGKVSYSSSGIGNLQHLNGELLKELASVDMIHVPYKGASGQLVDVISGNVDLTFVSYAAARPFLKDGKIKAIAVTSAKRSSFDPAVPAIAEYKPLAAYQLENWFGLFAPSKLPDLLVQKINGAVTQALEDPEFAKKLQEQGGEPAPMTPAQAKEFVARESTQFRRIVETAKITAE